MRIKLPPYTVADREYWRCPVHVLTGLGWFSFGVAGGVLLVAVTGVIR